MKRIEGGSRIEGADGGGGHAPLAARAPLGAVPLAADGGGGDCGHRGAGGGGGNGGGGV